MPDRDLQFFERVAALKREGHSFAVATVVSRRSPVSSHLGDRAIILSDGRMHGFVGGACSREIVRKHALEAIAQASPRLVQIRPEGAPQGFTPNANHVVVPMSCASEGAADVYIEPFARAPLLLLVGFSPVAEALARMGQALEHEVVRVVSDEEGRDLDQPGVHVMALQSLPSYLAALPADAGRRLAAVVASQGHYDELALESLLRARPLYLGLVASRKRGALVQELLRDRGISEGELESIHSPAGIDLGGTTPAEVAVSILAEIVQCTVRAGISRADNRPQAAMPVTAVAVDPVCAMEVEIATAMHTTSYDGRTFYFCCAHCKSRFEKEPARYLAESGSA